MIDYHEQEIAQRAAGPHAFDERLRDRMLIGARDRWTGEQNCQLLRFPQQSKKSAEFSPHLVGVLLRNGNLSERIGVVFRDRFSCAGSFEFAHEGIEERLFRRIVHLLPN